MGREGDGEAASSRDFARNRLTEEEEGGGGGGAFKELLMARDERGAVKELKDGDPLLSLPEPDESCVV